MADMWDRGTLKAAAWHHGHTGHGIRVFNDVADMIATALANGAMAERLVFEDMITASGLPCLSKAVVAEYQNHPRRVVGEAGDRYTFVDPEERDKLLQAVADAGAKPSGAFSLKDGRVTVATFDVSAKRGAKLDQHLMFLDSYDQSYAGTMGLTAVDPVCMNTVQAALSSDGSGMAKVRHTASLHDKIRILTSNVGIAIKGAATFAKVFEDASRVQLSTKAWKDTFEALWPSAAADATKQATTRANNTRAEALAAMRLPISKRDNPSNCARTMWDAATLLVDRRIGAHGQIEDRKASAETMLLGAQAKRVQEVYDVIKSVVYMTDGSVREVELSEAVRMGVPAEQALGFNVLDLDVSPSN